MKIVSINQNNIFLLENFIEHMGISKKTFRYFEKRNLTVLKNHLCTYLLIENKKNIAYGHLDKEDDKVWLGIAVTENMTGKGFGTLMMKELIATAKVKKIKQIHLSVDNDNKTAISLYKKNGFIIESKNKIYSIFKKNI